MNFRFNFRALNRLRCNGFEFFTFFTGFLKWNFKIHRRVNPVSRTRRRISGRISAFRSYPPRTPGNWYKAGPFHTRNCCRHILFPKKDVLLLSNKPLLFLPVIARSDLSRPGGIEWSMFQTRRRYRSALIRFSVLLGFPPLDRGKLANFCLRKFDWWGFDLCHSERSVGIRI